MPTSEMLFRKDAYARMTEAVVLAHTEQGGVILDRSLFYATGGGQPGDSGQLLWGDGQCTIATTVKGEGDAIVLVPHEGETLPDEGAEVTQVLDWDRRYGHMRVHTALHLLSVVIPLEVTGGSIGAEKGRLDFNMPDAPEDKQALQDQRDRCPGPIDILLQDQRVERDELLDALLRYVRFLEGRVLSD